jgi:hypothetical protein
MADDGGVMEHGACDKLRDILKFWLRFRKHKIILALNVRV